MNELFVTFLGGALGSSHCLGMCGGFALAIGTQSSGWRNNLLRQLIYSVGRVFTYSAAGAMAAYGGLHIAKGLPSSVPTQAILALVAGTFLLYEGLRACNWLPWKSSKTSSSCLGPRFFGPLLQGKNYQGAFLAGVFTGFLPCGLVYAFLALAASSPSVPLGAARMFAFGLGTIPLMVIAGIGGAALGLAARKHLFRIAGGCVAITGILSVARGLSFLGVFSGGADASCPFCQ